MSISDNVSMFYNAKPHIFEKAKMLRKKKTRAEEILWELPPSPLGDLGVKISGKVGGQQHEIPTESLGLRPYVMSNHKYSGATARGSKLKAMNKQRQIF